MLVHHHATAIAEHAPLATGRLHGPSLNTITLTASAAIIARIDDLAARDGISHAALLARAVEAYKLFPTLGPSGVTRSHLITFVVRAALIKEVANLIATDSIASDDFLYRAVQALQVMYPGPDYRSKS